MSQEFPSLFNINRRESLVRNPHHVSLPLGWMPARLPPASAHCMMHVTHYSTLGPICTTTTPLPCYLAHIKVFQISMHRPTRNSYHPDYRTFIHGCGQWVSVLMQRQDTTALWATHITEQFLHMVEYSDHVTQACKFDCNTTLSPSNNKNDCFFTDLPWYSGKTLFVTLPNG